MEKGKAGKNEREVWRNASLRRYRESWNQRVQFPLQIGVRSINSRGLGRLRQMLRRRRLSLLRFTALPSLRRTTKT